MDTLRLVIGNKNYSSWSLRPWLLLKTCGIGFQEIRIPLSMPDTRSRLLEYSPTGQVPVLLHGTLAIWDSLAICEYLAETVLDGRGWPADPRQRARCRSVSAEMHAGFSALRTELPLNCRSRRRVTPSAAAAGDIARIDAMWQSLRADHAAAGDWLCGEFTIADCMYAPVALRFRTYGITLAAAGMEYIATLLRHPPLGEWLSAAAAEPEVITAGEVGEPYRQE